MEYIYAALLLHKLGKPVSEENVKRVIEATGVQPDDVRAKALIAALSEINIDEALKSAVLAPAAAAPATAAPPAEAKEEKKAEKEKEKGKEEEEALAGLAGLFG